MTTVTPVSITHADGDPLGQFAIIQEDEGEWGLILREPLDREARDRYTLQVMATDGKFEAPLVVDVHVLDINDNSPLCEQVRTSYRPFIGLRWLLTSRSVLTHPSRRAAACQTHSHMGDELCKTSRLHTPNCTNDDN